MGINEERHAERLRGGCLASAQASSGKMEVKMKKEKEKVLIGDDSPDCGLRWAGALKEEGLFAITRRSEGESLLEAVVAEKPDYLVINAKMPGMDAAELLVRARRLLGRTPVAIVVGNHGSPQLEKEVMDAGASYFMVRPFDPRQLVRKIQALIDFRMGNLPAVGHHDITNIEYVVTDIIHRIGVPANLKGYQYLRIAIMLSVNDKEMLSAVTKALYPTIAHEFETSTSSVERAIRHAICIAWERGDVDALNSIFGCTVHSERGKPTNSEFIALVADKLRVQYFPRPRV